MDVDRPEMREHSQSHVHLSVERDEKRRRESRHVPMRTWVTGIKPRLFCENTLAHPECVRRKSTSRLKSVQEIVHMEGLAMAVRKLVPREYQLKHISGVAGKGRSRTAGVVVVVRRIVKDLCSAEVWVQQPGIFETRRSRSRASPTPTCGA